MERRMVAASAATARNVQRRHRHGTAERKDGVDHGSTDGVGRVVAKTLGARGMRVLVHGRDRARGELVVAEIKGGGGSAELLEADLSALAEVRRLAGAVRRATDRLDLLINNAGIGSGGVQGTRQTSADGRQCAASGDLHGHHHGAPVRDDAD